MIAYDCIGFSIGSLWFAFCIALLQSMPSETLVNVGRRIGVILERTGMIIPEQTIQLWFQELNVELQAGKDLVELLLSLSSNINAIQEFLQISVHRKTR